MGFFSGWIKFTTFLLLSRSMDFVKLILSFSGVWSFSLRVFVRIRKERSTPSRLSFGFNFLIKL